MTGEAGFDAAGDGDAGFGPEATAATARTVVPPQALYLDAAVMDFTADAAGHYQSVHPVDSKVEIGLAVAFGSVASAATVGSSLRDLKIGTRAQMTLDARAIVDAALAALLAAGDIVIVSVVAYAKSANRAHVEIVYQNLRADDPDRTRTAVVT